ncbi:hypothetical protein BGZ93_005689, partial [Podila epicladia]
LHFSSATTQADGVIRGLQYASDIYQDKSNPEGNLDRNETKGRLAALWEALHRERGSGPIGPMKATTGGSKAIPCVSSQEHTTTNLDGPEQHGTDACFAAPDS